MGLKEAVQFLAEELAKHRCSWGAGHDSHEQCETPDWNWIGKGALRLLKGGENEDL